MNTNKNAETVTFNLTAEDGDGWAVLTYPGEGLEAAAAAKDWLREQGVIVIHWGGSSSNPRRTTQRVRLSVGERYWGWQARR